MIENRDTIKRLSATAAGLGASGLLEREVGVNAGSSVVTGEDGQGSKDRSSSDSQFPPKCTQKVIIALLNAVRKKVRLIFCDILHPYPLLICFHLFV